VTSQAPAGWYPDPSGAPGQRWWDGQAWSITAPPVSPPVPVPSPYDASYPGAALPGAGAPYSYQPTPQPAPNRGFAQGGNRFALTTFAVVAVYILLAIETHFVVLGLFPLALSLRSRRAREPLAPLAIVAAALSIVVAGAIILGH
jgi:Protein of unknown function (DUF2510)